MQIDLSSHGNGVFYVVVADDNVILCEETLSA